MKKTGQWLQALIASTEDLHGGQQSYITQVPRIPTLSTGLSEHQEGT